MPGLGLLLLLGLSLAGALQPGLEPPERDPTEEGARLFASDYNSTAEEVLFRSVLASWNYNTNLTEENAALQVGGGRCHHGGVPSAGAWGGSLWVPPCLRAAVSAPRGGEPGMGLVAQELRGFAPNWFSERLCPKNDSCGPRAESRLFLEVIPSSQHLPLFISPFPGLGQVSVLSLSPSLPGVSTSRRSGLSLGQTQDPKCTNSRVAPGLRLSPLVPASPADGDKGRGGKGPRAVEI